ncbi:MAG: transposase [Flavobacteriales bacterium]|nr:transposase [Flavobacteriales bacterium]
MRKSKWTEAQIVAMLHEHEQGRKVADLCREHGVSQPTFYRSGTITLTLPDRSR